jgi:hypothetical protein
MARVLNLKQFISIAIIMALSLVIVSCTPTGTTGPHGIVTLRDGTKYAGTLVKSSTNEITFAGDDNTTRTFNMQEVKSVDYGELKPAVAQAQEQAAQPAAGRPQSVPKERYRPAESVITTKTNELPVGTEVTVRTDETIDSRKAAEGQVYAAEISKDVLDTHGDVVLPRGSNAQVVLRSASKGGHFTGASDLILDLKSVSVDGRLYQLNTADLRRKGKDGIGANKRTAGYVGTGAAVGAIIGAIAGQGKGAAIGAGSGAAAGAITEIVTKGGDVRVPAETLLTFRLDKPLRVYPVR